MSLGITFALSACGSGSSSSNSSGSAGDPVAAKACIDFKRDFNDGDAYSIFDNDCNYDINVAEIDGGSDEPSHLVKANSQISIREYFFSWGACRAPYIVDEGRPLNYRCSMP